MVMLTKMHSIFIAMSFHPLASWVSPLNVGCKHLGIKQYLTNENDSLEDEKYWNNCLSWRLSVPCGIQTPKVAQ